MRNILFALIAIATTGCTDFLAGYATVEGWENHGEDTGDAVVDTNETADTTVDTTDTDVAPPEQGDPDTGDAVVDTNETADTTSDTGDVDCIHIMMIKQHDVLTITVQGDTSDGSLEFWTGSYSNHQSEPWAVADGYVVIPLVEFQQSDPFTDVNFSYHSEVVTATVV